MARGPIPLLPGLREALKRRRSAAPVEFTDEQRAEGRRCHPGKGSAAFDRFCARHIQVEDALTKRMVPFVLFSGQRRIIPDLVAGRWLLQLKGRQLGFTTLWAAYVVWRIIFSRAFRVVVICQERQYAEDFVLRVKSMIEHLPDFLRPKITRDTTRLLRFGTTREVRALVGSDKAARSVTADLVLYDEASRVPGFALSLGAAQPSIELAHGQIGVLTTSAGPAGDFYELWLQTYGDHGELLDADGVGPTGFKIQFIHWSERPGRDQAWYKAEKTRLDRLGPTVVKQEYPDTPEEAFEYAAGRVYPIFTRDRCIGDIIIPTTAERVRAIDWGETKSAYVVLWIAYIPGPTGLLVSPKCPNTIREFLAYRWDEEAEGRPVKRDDHCPDGVRYAVVRWNLKGLVYVYREIYRMDSVAKGWHPMLEIKEIHEMSGWERDEDALGHPWIRGKHGEEFRGTVADRSWGKAIAEMNANQIPCVPSKPIARRGPIKGEGGRDTVLNEVLEGIRQVSAVIDGSEFIDKRIEVIRDGAAMRVYYEQRRRAAGRVPHTTSLRERMIQEAARSLLRSRRPLP